MKRKDVENTIIAKMLTPHNFMAGIVSDPKNPIAVKCIKISEKSFHTIMFLNFSRLRMAAGNIIQGLISVENLEKSKVKLGCIE